MKKLLPAVKIKKEFLASGEQEIITGINHFECMQKYFGSDDLKWDDVDIETYFNKVDEGFVDSDGKWYSRQEAMEYAKKNDLLRSEKELEGSMIDGYDSLYNESLKPIEPMIKNKFMK
jgi:hypothetical protein